MTAHRRDGIAIILEMAATRSAEMIGGSTVARMIEDPTGMIGIATLIVDGGSLFAWTLVRSMIPFLPGLLRRLLRWILRDGQCLKARVQTQQSDGLLFSRIAATDGIS